MFTDIVADTSRASHTSGTGALIPGVRDVLSRDACDHLIRRITGLARGGGITWVTLASGWRGDVRWGRNRASLPSDATNTNVQITRALNAQQSALVRTTQIDDESLEQVVRQAERLARRQRLQAASGPVYLLPVLPSPENTPIWSEATRAVTREQRATLVRQLTDPAERHDVLSTGYIKMETRAAARNCRIGDGERSKLDVMHGYAEAELGVAYYTKVTASECSITVWDPRARASGWAGLSSYDWTRIDPAVLAQRALEKCLASRNPVRVEPGRYTVILEPQAVFDFFGVSGISVDRLTEWYTTDGQPFSRATLGQRIMDERLSVSHDPMDQELGLEPSPGLAPVRWVDRGVLMDVTYDRAFALQSLNENSPIVSRISYRVDVHGEQARVEDMIANTRRGLLVTRFDDVRLVSNLGISLWTGVTRNGVWLIERGKIAKAVTNLRFTETQQRVLNSIEQIGTPVKVLGSAIVPALKVRDFAFTGLTDAV